MRYRLSITHIDISCSSYNDFESLGDGASAPPFDFARVRCTIVTACAALAITSSIAILCAVHRMATHQLWDDLQHSDTGVAG